MPWRPKYTEVEARVAIKEAHWWADALSALGLGYNGRNIRTLRKWAERWEIRVDHLPSGASGSRHVLRYTEAEARAAIAASRSWAEALRRLGYCQTGSNYGTLKRRATDWEISTTHFDPHAAARDALRREPRELTEILSEVSSYDRGALKQRLYDSGLKQRRCELCGQSELWRGKRMGLILDHVNGVRDDNRIENLRIVCPNCAATLETHCGRRNRIPRQARSCLHCDTSFQPKSNGQRYCSRYCGTRWDRTGLKRSGARKKHRPPHDELLRDVEEHGYRGVARRLGVSDNSVRKWLRQYEREQAIADGRDPGTVEIPRGTWPNRRRGQQSSSTRRPTAAGAGDR